METVFQYRIPIWHPIAVHFPLVLIMLAALCALIWLMGDRREMLRAALWCQVLGFMGGLAAFLTGEEAEEQSEGVRIVDELVELHETFALVTLWVAGIAAVAMLGVLWWRRRDVEGPGTRLAIRLAVFALVLAAAVAVGITGHIGGTMVWGVPK